MLENEKQYRIQRWYEGYGYYPLGTYPRMKKGKKSKKKIKAGNNNVTIGKEVK